MSFENEYEQELYNASVKKLLRFREVDLLVSHLHDFTWNFKTLYEDTQRNIANNNILSRKEEVNDVLLLRAQVQKDDVKEFVIRYKSLMDNLIEYPEWQKKVREEIGHYAHLIYINLQEKEKERLFEGFDLKQYFV